MSKIFSKIFRFKFPRQVLNLLLFITFFLAQKSESYAIQQIQEVNYFASLRASETNVRSGPGGNYPIKFTFKIRDLPVKVISEYDNWCEIEDYEKGRGWVAQNLLTKKRHLMTYSKNKIINMHRKKNINSRLVYKLENFVIGEFIECDAIWCAIEINKKKGWVENQHLYGFDNQDF